MRLGETAQLSLGTIGKQKGGAVLLSANQSSSRIDLKDGRHRSRVSLTAEQKRSGLVVTDEEHLVGIVTKMDFVDHLTATVGQA